MKGGVTMFALMIYLTSTNPSYGPVWFGAIADVFIIASVVYLIVSHKSEGNNGKELGAYHRETA